MYRVLTSFWSKPPTTAISSNKPRLSSINSFDSSIDEDSWVFVNETISKVPSTIDSQNLMNTSWIASPPLIRTDQSPSNPRSISPSSSSTHHFNPIENLLIEHASMSVYEQIASRTRARRHRKDQKLNEQVESVGEDEQEDDDDEDDRSSVVFQFPSQHPNLSSIHHRNLNSSLSTLESSTSSLAAHQRHLQRIHQRRRRAQPTKTSSKLVLTNNNNNNISGVATNIDESKLTSNKMIERQRCFTHARTPKLVLHQPCRSNH